MNNKGPATFHLSAVRQTTWLLSRAQAMALGSSFARAAQRGVRTKKSRVAQREAQSEAQGLRRGCAPLAQGAAQGWRRGWRRCGAGVAQIEA